MTRKLYPLGFVLAVCFMFVFAVYPMPARAQASEWDKITILPESGNWNFPGYFLLTAQEDAVVSWEIKCTEGGCGGRQPEVVTDVSISAGETIRVGWGHQCYRWQFDPFDASGYIAEAEPELCVEDTPTPTEPVTEDTPTSTPETPTPTDPGTEETPTATPETPTPTSTGTLVTTPPTTPGTATPTSTGTIVTTPPATPGTATATPDPTATVTPSPPPQTPPETPRSQLIAVTGADLSTQARLPRLLVSVGIVFAGLGMVGLGIARKWKR